jgi:hypothetical protein
MEKGCDYNIKIIFEGILQEDRIEAIIQDHELSTIGTEFTTEDSLWGTLDIARIVKVDDAKGRKHECILKFFYGWIGKQSTGCGLFFNTIVDSIQSNRLI